MIGMGNIGGYKNPFIGTKGIIFPMYFYASAAFFCLEIMIVRVSARTEYGILLPVVAERFKDKRSTDGGISEIN